jgi:hypothetical protein
MENEKDGEITEDKYLPGQLKLGLPAFEKYPRTKRHWMASTPVVEDTSFMLGPLEWPGDPPEDSDEWALGSDW